MAEDRIFASSFERSGGGNRADDANDQDSTQRSNIKRTVNIPDAPTSIIHLLSQNHGGAGSVDYQSLRSLTLKLQDKIHRLMSAGKILVKDLYVDDDNDKDSYHRPHHHSGGKCPSSQKKRGASLNNSASAEKSRRGTLQLHNQSTNSPTFKSPSPSKKDMQYWDKQGGVNGLSTWLIYDFLSVKQKSVTWLHNWIENLQGKEINTIVDQKSKNYTGYKADNAECSGADESDDPMERTSRSDIAEGAGENHGHRELDNSKIGIVNMDQNMFSIANSKYMSLTGKSQSKKNKRVYQHHEQPSIRNLLENYPISPEKSPYYVKCQQKNFKGFRDSSKCHENKLCTFQKMEAQGDSIAALPMPLPAGAQGAQQSNLANERFANKEFPNRNIIQEKQHFSSSIDKVSGDQNISTLPHQNQATGAAREAILKKENSRWVATENQLDHWHAQSIGISHHDYIDKKRAYQRLSRGQNFDKVTHQQAQSKQNKKKMNQNMFKNKLVSEETHTTSKLVQQVQEQNQLQMSQSVPEINEPFTELEKRQLSNKPVLKQKGKRNTMKNWDSQNLHNHSQKQNQLINVNSVEGIQQNHLTKTQNQLNRENVLNQKKLQLKQFLLKKQRNQPRLSSKNNQRTSVNTKAKSSTIDSFEKSPETGNAAAPKFEGITETISFQQLLKQAQDRSDSRTMQNASDYKNLKSITYSKFEQPKSQVITMVEEKRQHHLDGQQASRSGHKYSFNSKSINNADSRNQGGYQHFASSDNLLKSDHDRNTSPNKNKQRHDIPTLERKQLLESLGGFYNKKIKNLYYEQLARTIQKKDKSSHNHQFCTEGSMDLQRRLICMTDMQHYNQQKQEIERLLLQNKQKNKEAESKKQRSMKSQIKQKRQQQSPRKADIEQYIARQQLMNIPMNGQGTMRSQSINQIATKNPTAQIDEQTTQDPYDIKSIFYQKKQQYNQAYNPFQRQEASKSRNENCRSQQNMATEPELKKELNPEVYNSLQSIRKQNEFMRQKQKILINSFNKMKRTFSAQALKHSSIKNSGEKKQQLKQSNEPQSAVTSKDPSRLVGVNQIIQQQPVISQFDQRYQSAQQIDQDNQMHIIYAKNSIFHQNKMEMQRPRSVNVNTKPRNFDVQSKKYRQFSKGTKVPPTAEQVPTPSQLQNILSNGTQRNAFNVQSSLSNLYGIKGQQLKRVQSSHQNIQQQKSLMMKHFLYRQPVESENKSQQSDKYGSSSIDDDASQQNRESPEALSFEGRLKNKSDAVKRLIIQREIRNDNTLDIEGTKQDTGCDPRMVKVALKSIDFSPGDTVRNKKFDFNDANFWFIKGYNHCHNGVNEEESAIDSYRQAIGIDPFHIQSIHNLACVYENQKRFKLAIKWFSIAIELKQVDQDLKNAYYGIALSYFKSGNASYSIAPLDTAIKQLDEQILHDKQTSEMNGNVFRKKKWYDYFYFRYLRALSHRVLGNYRDSERDYTDIVESFKEQEGLQICRNIFSMVIIPFEDNRRRILRLVDQFQQILDKYEVERDRIILHQHYIEGQNPPWKENKLKHVHTLLMHLSFFKKFSAVRIRQMMNKVTIKIVKSGSILFFQPEKVYVIVGGSLLMQNHQKKTDLPVTHAKFINGAILNFLQDQSEIFNSLETWFVAQVTTEIAVFDKSYFREVWNNDVMTEQLMFMKSYLKCYDVFKKFSDLALMILVSELTEFKVFKKDHIIMPQSAVAPSGAQHQEFIRGHKLIQNDKKKSMKKCAHHKKKTVPPSAQATDVHKHEEDKGVHGSGDTEDHTSHCNSDEEGDTNDHSALGSPRKGVAGFFKKKEQVQAKGINSRIRNEDTLLRDTRDWMNEVKKVEESAKPSLVQNKDIAGLYIIIKGRCKVVHKKDNILATYLQGGECFGESDLLKIVGFDFFGDIIADSNEVECLYISQQNFQKIPLFEQNNIRDYAINRQAIRYLAYEYCKSYKLDFQDYQNPKN